jgi:hypothetical protein
MASGPFRSLLVAVLGDNSGIGTLSDRLDARMQGSFSAGRDVAQKD